MADKFNFRKGILYLDGGYISRVIPSILQHGYFCRACNPDYLDKLKDAMSLPEQYTIEYYRTDEFHPLVRVLISSDEFPEATEANMEWPRLHAEMEYTYLEDEKRTTTRINKLWVEDQVNSIAKP